MLCTIRTSKSIWQIFKSHIPRFCLTIFCDILCPLILFFVLEKYLKLIYVFLIAGLPPLMMIIVKAIICCSFDVLGFLICLSFLLSALIAILTRNEFIFLFEKSLITLIISITFGLTLIPCSYCHWWKPLAFYIYQELIPIERNDLDLSEQIIFDRILLDKNNEIKSIYDWMYKYCSSFRLACFLITNIWFIGFLFEFFIRLILIIVFHLSIKKIIIYGHILLTSITIFCIILTVVCITKERKQTLESIELWKNEYVHEIKSTNLPA